MLGTPSLTAKAIVIGERVQNFRCRQPEGSGSSGKLCAKSITVTTGPPLDFNTSRRPPKNCQPITPATATIVMPANRKYRARKVIVAFIPVCTAACTAPPTIGALRAPARRAMLGSGEPAWRNAMPTQIGDNRTKKMLKANELVFVHGGQPVAHPEHR